jgi:GrpB-like predicted nucleotidyltransferase (UPF0157 family)
VRFNARSVKRARGKVLSRDLFTTLKAFANAEVMIWEKLSQYHLGLRKGQVELVGHDGKWVEAYSLLVDEIRTKVPPAICEFYHIGSTSIPGICAKPILDVLGTTPSLKEFDSYKSIFESLGFTWKGEFGVSGRRYCPLYDNSGLTAFVHLHVFQKDTAEVKSHLHFRDRLRADPNLANEYDSLKQSSATQFKVHREKYTESKSSFIQKMSKQVD